MSEEAGPEVVDDATAGSAFLSDFVERMRIKPGDDERTVLSKKLSFVLRHGAKQLDLEIDDNGFIDVNDLLALEELFKGVTLEALREVVQQSNVDKQRYELLEDGGKSVIRATGKHTMQGLAGSKDKRSKRNQSKEEAQPGDRPAPSSPPQISEEEFCQKYKLDKWARQRLSELPPASRQLAMRKFNPEEDVPQTDYPKLFVAFCKRFRAKGGGREQMDSKAPSSLPLQTSPSQDEGESPPRRTATESQGSDAMAAASQQQKEPLPKPQPAPRPQFPMQQPVQQYAPPPPQGMPVAPRGAAYQHPPPPPDHAPGMQPYPHQAGPPLATPGMASCRDSQMQWGWQQQMRQPAMQPQQWSGSNYEEQCSYSQPMMSDQRDSGHQGWSYGSNQWNQWQQAPRPPARMDASSRKYGAYTQNNMSQYSQPGYYNPQAGWGYGSGQ